jgi:glutamyl-tRNA reductase
VARFHPAVVDISTVLARTAGMGVTNLGDSLYVHFDEAAAEHLLRVASGLDSMVVGESQILGQLRAAYVAGTEAATVGKVLHEAGQTALRVGKRVHSETGIDRAGASVVSVALEHASRVFAAEGRSLVGRRIVILGAGAMGALAGATLQRLAAGAELDVVVLNRSAERAERLAASLGGRAGALDALAREIADADVLISSTGATGLVVEASDVAPRDGRKLVVLDLALPRDVDPAVALMAGVHYLDLEGLRNSGAMVSDAEIEAAATIVAGELREYLTHQQVLGVAPTVTALRARAAQVVDAELLRLNSRLPGLDPTVRDELASAVRRAVDKVLHAPTVRVKELAATPEGNSYAAALRELFDLDPNRPGSVTAVSRAGLVDVAAEADPGIGEVR